MCGQHNARASAKDSTGHNTKAAELEGRDSRDHATATDYFEICIIKLI